MRINQKLPACVYVPFLKSTFCYKQRIIEILQYLKYPTSLIKNFFDKTASTFLHMFVGLLSSIIIKLRKSKKFLEKNRKTVVA